MNESQNLLAAYAAGGSEDAFRELLARYVDLVYSTAFRLVAGDSHLAEDVTQTVFLNLARRAGTFGSNVLLGGWLHRDTCFTASKLMRAERRRKLREQKAAEMILLESDDTLDAQIASFLDAAINELREEDRKAILIRFYEKRDLRSVGGALGVSENAAQKRIQRAVERLRTILKRRGVSVTEAALLAFFIEKAVISAPAGIVSSLAVAVLSATTAHPATILTLLMANKISVTVGTAVLVASIVTPLFLQRNVRAKVREQETQLLSQRAELTALSDEVNRLRTSAAQTQRRAASPVQYQELMRRRGTVTLLRQELTKLQGGPARPRGSKLASLAEQYSARVADLKGYLLQHSSESIPELQFLSDEDWLWLAGERTDTTDDGRKLAMSLARLTAEGNLARDILRPALNRFAEENSGRFPANIPELANYADRSIPPEMFQRWTILPARKLVGLAANLAGEDLVITQSAPVNPLLDQRIVFSLRDFHMFANGRPEQWNVAP